MGASDLRRLFVDGLLLFIVLLFVLVAGLWWLWSPAEMLRRRAVDDARLAVFQLLLLLPLEPLLGVFLILLLLGSG